MIPRPSIVRRWSATGAWGWLYQDRVFALGVYLDSSSGVVQDTDLTLGVNLDGARMA